MGPVIKEKSLTCPRCLTPVSEMLGVCPKCGLDVLEAINHPQANLPSSPSTKGWSVPRRRGGMLSRYGIAPGLPLTETDPMQPADYVNSEQGLRDRIADRFKDGRWYNPYTSWAWDWRTVVVLALTLAALIYRITQYQPGHHPIR